jgi:energy-coupling factor transporter ATP-binding protein EcfA2
MRLTKVKVEGLFGRFTYSVDLKLEDRITILHGPNGCGKTTLLRLVGNALTGRYDAILQAVFSRLCLQFDNGAHVVFERHRFQEQKRPKGRSSFPYKLIARFDGQEGEIRLLTVESRERLAHFIDQFVPGYHRVDVDSWIHAATGAHASLEELFLEHSDRLPSHLREQVAGREGKLTQSLRDFLRQMKVFVIDTQRLIAARDAEMVVEETSRGMMRRHRGVEPITPAVVSYANLLKESIRDHLQKYGIKASTLDRSLPHRILSAARSHDSPDKLRARYKAVLNRRSNLVNAGVLQETEGFDVPFPDTLEPLAEHVLHVYIDDMESKLSVFDGFAERVQLFKSLIHGLFKYKKISVGPNTGFEFITDENQTLTPDRLSSGEQHQLVLLFDLLFRVDEHSLILVDEPELSLHVEWQQKVLNNFSEISKLRDLDFLIATHSPDVIHDRWDLTTALTGDDPDA